MKWRAVGVVVAVVVALGLAYVSWAYYAYQHGRYVHTGDIPPPVLVATQFIPKDTPGRLIATGPMYAPTTLPEKEREDGAILDPAYLSGRASAVDIFPGEQLTETDFTPPLAWARR